MKFNVTEVEFDFDLDYAKLTFDEEIEVRTLHSVYGMQMMKMT